MEWIWSWEFFIFFFEFQRQIYMVTAGNYLQISGMEFTLISLHSDPAVVFHCANILVVWVQTNPNAQSLKHLLDADEYSHEQMWIGRWPSKPHSNHWRWADIRDALSYVHSSSSSFYMLFISSIPSGTLCSLWFRIAVATGFQNNHLCSSGRHISWNNHRLAGLLLFC